MNAATGPRWYCVNNMGMATLCADKSDAEDVASECDIAFPRQAPHRAVQLVEVSELEKERTARIEAQQRLADMQELAAKSGLAHRLSVQRCVQAAVAEAVAAEREACALVCDEFFVPEQVLGAHPDYLEGKHMAKSQCSAAIRARGTP